MVTETIEKSLSKLEVQIRNGVLVPTKYVREFTMVCYTERSVLGGIVYRQQAFETLHKDFQKVFKNRVKGEQVGWFKIIAIFDIWLPECPSYIPAAQVKDDDY